MIMKRNKIETEVRYVGFDYQQFRVLIKNDSTRLKAIIFHLISNSVQSLSQKGRLIIEIKRLITEPDGSKSLNEGNELKYEKDITSLNNIYCLNNFRITIRDTGHGIQKRPLENIQKSIKSIKLFEKYTLNDQQNIGFGLTISQYLLSALTKPFEKELVVNSEYGKGTQFTFQIFSRKEQLTRPGRNIKYKTFCNIPVIKEVDDIVLMKRSSNDANPKFHSQIQNLVSTKSQINSEKQRKIEDIAFFNYKPNDENFDCDNEFKNIEQQNQKIQQHFDKLINKHVQLVSEAEIIPAVAIKEQIEKNNQIEISFGGENQILKQEEKEWGNSILQLKETQNEHECHISEQFCDCNLVLIADDEQFNLMALTLAFSEVGITTIEQQNGIDVMEFFSQDFNQLPTCGQINCTRLMALVSDIGMPMLDGFEVARQVRSLMKDQKLPEFPLIAYSAFNLPEDVTQSFESGFNSFWEKGKLDIQQLLTYLKQSKSIQNYVVN